MIVYLRRVGVAVSFGILCVMNVSAMQGEGQSASQSGDAKNCIKASGLMWSILQRCTLFANSEGLSTPLCAGVEWWGDGRDICKEKEGSSEQARDAEKYDMNVKAVDFVRAQKAKPYKSEMGDEACESMLRLRDFMSKGWTETTLDMALEACKRRKELVAEHKAFVYNNGSLQARERLVARLLAMDSVLGQYSDRSFSLWEARFRLHDYMSEDYVYSLVAQESKKSESVAYDRYLGDSACHTLKNDERCKLRWRLLATEPMKGAVAAKNVEVLNAFRKLDHELSVEAFAIVRRKDLYAQSQFAGFSVGKS